MCIYKNIHPNNTFQAEVVLNSPRFSNFLNLYFFVFSIKKAVLRIVHNTNVACFSSLQTLTIL